MAAQQYDVHTCGLCKVQFLSIESFILHKQKSCPFLQPANTEHHDQDVYLVLNPREKTSKGLDLEKVHRAIQAHRSSPVKINSSPLQPVHTVSKSQFPSNLRYIHLQSPGPGVGWQPVRPVLPHSQDVEQCHIYQKSVCQKSPVVQSVHALPPVSQISLRYVQQKSLVDTSSTHRTHQAVPHTVGNEDTDTVFPAQTLSTIHVRSSEEINQALEFLKMSSGTSNDVGDARQQYSQANSLGAHNIHTTSAVVVEPAQGSEPLQSIMEESSQDSQYVNQGQTLSTIHVRSSEEINQALEFLKMSSGTSNDVGDARQQYSQANSLGAHNIHTTSAVVVEPAQGSEPLQSIMEESSQDSQYVNQGFCDDLAAGTCTSDDDFDVTEDTGTTSHPEQDELAPEPFNQALKFLKPTEESTLLQEFYDEQVKKEVSQILQSSAEGNVSNIIPTRLCCIKSSNDSTLTKVEGEVGQLINQALFFLKPVPAEDVESEGPKTGQKKKTKLIWPVPFKDPVVGCVGSGAKEAGGLGVSKPAATAVEFTTEASVQGNQHTLIDSSKDVARETLSTTLAENQSHMSQPCSQDIPDQIISKPNSKRVIFDPDKFVNQGAFFLNPDRTRKPAEEQISNAVQDVQTLLVLHQTRVLTAQPTEPVQSLPISESTVCDSVQVGETGGVVRADTNELVGQVSGNVLPKDLANPDGETNVPILLQTVGLCKRAREETAVINQARFFLTSTHGKSQPHESDISQQDLTIMLKNTVKSTKKAPVVIQKKTKNTVNSECDEFGDILQSEKNLNAHQAAHEDKRCRIFYSKKETEKHEYNKHNIEPCKKCGKVCKNYAGWKAHMRSHEPKSGVQFPCDQCERKYDSEFLLKQHKRRHEGKKDCSLCGKVCKSERVWKLHMKRHNPTVACDNCDMKFISKVKLERHLRVAHRKKSWINAKRQKCENCYKVFRSPWGFQKHTCRITHEVKSSIKIRKSKWTKVEHTRDISTTSASCGNKQLNDIKDCDTMSTACTSKDTAGKLSDADFAGKLGDEDFAGILSDEDSAGKLSNEEDFAGQFSDDEDSEQLSEEDSDDTLALIREAILGRKNLVEGDAEETTEPEEVQFVAEMMPTGAVKLKIAKRKHGETQLPGDVANEKQVEKKSTGEISKKRKVEDIDDVAADTSGPTEGVNDLKCVVCKHEFQNEFSFITHGCMMIKQLTCKLCKKKFDDFLKFRNHRVRHRLIHFECDKCNVSFRSVDAWRAHMEQHKDDGGERHKCESCVMEFFHKERLLLHAKKHAFENVHECCICPRVFMTKHALKKHEQSHVEPEYYQCKICQKNFVFKANFRLHRRNCRECRVCNKMFDRLSAYKKHLRNFHTVFHVCEYCGKKSRKLKIHLRHLSRHTNPLKCKVCDRVFKFKSTLVDHEVIHFSDRPINCTFCEKTFKVDRSRIVHEHICHPSENPWKCKRCGETFLQRMSFRMHAESCSKLAS